MSALPISLLVDADARRRWFGLDALVTGANALGYLLLADRLAERLGGEAGTVRSVGAGLAVFALVVAGYAGTRGRRDDLGWTIVAANGAWVVVSLAVAIVGAGGFDGFGRGWIALQAVVVAALTALQVGAMRR